MQRYLGILVQLTYLYLCTVFNEGFRIGDSCYKLFREPETWSVARQLCMDRGGYLAELTTRDELTAALTALGRFGERFLNSKGWCYLGQYLFSSGFFLFLHIFVMHTIRGIHLILTESSCIRPVKVT